MNLRHDKMRETEVVKVRRQSVEVWKQVEELLAADMMGSQKERKKKSVLRKTSLKSRVT